MLNQIQMNIRRHPLNPQPPTLILIISLLKLPPLRQRDSRKLYSMRHIVCGYNEATTFLSSVRNQPTYPNNERGKESLNKRLVPHIPLKLCT